jgi:hypothetical protein
MHYQLTGGIPIGRIASRVLITTRLSALPYEHVGFKRSDATGEEEEQAGE